MKKTWFIFGLVAIIFMVSKTTYTRDSKAVKSMLPAYDENFCVEQIVKYVSGEIGTEDVTCSCSRQCLEIAEGLDNKWEASLDCFKLLSYKDCFPMVDQEEIFEKIGDVIKEMRNEHPTPME